MKKKRLVDSFYFDPRTTTYSCFGNHWPTVYLKYPKYTPDWSSILYNDAYDHVKNVPEHFNLIENSRSHQYDVKVYYDYCETIVDR